MLLKTEMNLIKIIGTLLFLGSAGTPLSHAQKINCEQANTPAFNKICHADLQEIREQLNDQFLTAFLVTDAPLRILQDTHQLWFKRAQQCKTTECFKQQFEARLDQLNFFSSMNQSMIQHYLKFEQGQLAKQPVHLQIHQLNKDSIKIEGVAYRSPNNKLDTQTISLLAYTSPQQKQHIIDNEHDCNYQLDFQKAYLAVRTEQKGCERFSGIYRLYD
ncbi:A1S_1983 family putative colistin resistance protein [Acinetobacter indicus]|uniref:A1S_1983 family putative colistin resistance protein n=1 Tax=Acinetobacter indicus TaxID=756892 RepID=UPI002575895F|nr:hypothetical protein [Acinetobacter indicus]MDM1285867.1 hypothetical protein [Acinetobacter indicus]